MALILLLFTRNCRRCFINIYMRRHEHYLPRRLRYCCAKNKTKTKELPKPSPHLWRHNRNFNTFLRSVVFPVSFSSFFRFKFILPLIKPLDAKKKKKIIINLGNMVFCICFLFYYGETRLTTNKAQQKTIFFCVLICISLSDLDCYFDR